MISIHAPLWGATQSINIPDSVTYIDFNPRTLVGCDDFRETDMILLLIKYFNPRALVGCDFITDNAVLGFPNFNPRTLARCDNDYLPISITLLWISIHTPWWGATSISENVTWGFRFQSTHLGGVRLCKRYVQFNRTGNFNPRTLVGCDCKNI